MNNFDINKSQVQALGYLSSTKIPEYSERRLTRELLAEMSKNGKIDEAFDMIFELVEDLKKRVMELENK